MCIMISNSCSLKHSQSLLCGISMTSWMLMCICCLCSTTLKYSICSCPTGHMYSQSALRPKRRRCGWDCECRYPCLLQSFGLMCLLQSFHQLYHSNVLTVCTQAKETTMRMRLWVSIPMSVTELRQLLSLRQHSQSPLRPRNRILSMRFWVPGRTTSKGTSASQHPRICTDGN